MRLMITVGQVHLALAVAAIISGAAVVVLPKGTGSHRLVGFIYALGMFGVVGTALLIYNLTGRFGPFHVLAVISLITMVLGVAPVLLRKPDGGWIGLHAYFMAWSYVGLLAAAAAETLTRVPSAPFWGSVVAASLFVVAVGAWIVNTSVPRILEDQFGMAPRSRHAVGDENA
jgi:uncharacterized membrane protein